MSLGIGCYKTLAVSSLACTSYADVPGDLYATLQDLRSITLTASVAVDENELDSKVTHLFEAWYARP